MLTHGNDDVANSNREYSKGKTRIDTVICRVIDAVVGR